MDVIVTFQLTKNGVWGYKEQDWEITKSSWLSLLTQDNHWKGTLVIIYLKKSVVRNKIQIVIVLREVDEWKISEPELI